MVGRELVYHDAVTGFELVCVPLTGVGSNLYLRGDRVGRTDRGRQREGKVERGVSASFGGG